MSAATLCAQAADVAIDATLQALAPTIVSASLPKLGTLVTSQWGSCFGLPRLYRVVGYQRASEFCAAINLLCGSPDGSPVGWHGLTPIRHHVLAPSDVLVMEG